MHLHALPSSHRPFVPATQVGGDVHLRLPSSSHRPFVPATQGGRGRAPPSSLPLATDLSFLPRKVAGDVHLRSSPSSYRPSVPATQGGRGRAPPRDAAADSHAARSRRPPLHILTARLLPGRHLPSRGLPTWHSLSSPPGPLDKLLYVSPCPSCEMAGRRLMRRCWRAGCRG